MHFFDFVCRFPPFPPFPSVSLLILKKGVVLGMLVLTFGNVTLVEICEPRPFIQVTLKNPPNPSDIRGLSGIPKHFADLCLQTLLPVIEG